MTPTTTAPQRGVFASFAFLLISMLSAQALAFDVGGFSYDVLNATDVEVTGCDVALCASKDITIPATASDGTTTYSVAIIGEGAFVANALTSVIIPDSVTTIGDSAFPSNALTSVIIPDSVTIIGNFAFTGNALTSVIIPDSVRAIGNFAFYNNALTSVTIPDSVEAIGLGGFGLNALTSAVFEGNFGGFQLDMFEYNADLATITYAQGASGWDAPLRTFTPDTGPTGSVTAEAAAPPASPAAPTATAGDSQASVTWTKPADGGSTITGYTVTSAPGSNTCTTSDADTLTCDVTGLTNGKAYTFTVTATNGVGTSAASAASTSVTPVAPAPSVPTVATPVPTSPLWLLGIMAGLLSLVAVRKLSKA